MNKDEVTTQLQVLGLSRDEANVFIALLEGNKTHQQISETTSINRTTVYRVVDELAQKGIAHEVATDEGRLVASADLSAVEMLVAEHELELKEKKEALAKLLELAPSLQPEIDAAFTVKTFYGVTGLKQMLWNELRSQGEILIFSHHDSINTIAGKRFAEKFRGEIIARGIKQRALCNGQTITASALDYTKYYNEKFIDRSVLPISQDVTIHDDTVSIYNWEKDIRVGTEIHNRNYADFMRHFFERFWADVSD